MIWFYVVVGVSWVAWIVGLYMADREEAKQNGKANRK